MESTIDRILVVIDVQNDFVTGTLANPEAQKAIPEITKRVEEFGDSRYPIVFTKDLHSDKSYMDTQEGKKLPIKHCLLGTHGRDIVREVYGATPQTVPLNIIDKNTFGSKDLPAAIKNIIRSRERNKDIDKIYIVGFCTDICVIVNALLLKTSFPEMEIYVISDGCAGTTPTMHKMALEVMKSCQVNVI